MVIAEVLNEIKDQEKRRRELQSKVRENVFILPDLREDEKPDTLEDNLAELQAVVNHIAGLKVQLIKANLATLVTIQNILDVTEDVTLMGAIKQIETYRYFENQLADLANIMDNKGARFFSHGGYMTQGEAVKLNPNFKTSAKEIRKRSQAYREAARRIEQALVKKNWQTDVT